MANAVDDKLLDGIAHCSNQLVLYLKQNLSLPKIS